MGRNQKKRRVNKMGRKICMDSSKIKELSAQEFQLLEVVRYGNHRTVQACLDGGVNANCWTVSGNECALGIAIKRQNLMSAECLLRAGAPIESQDQLGMTPLMLAVCGQMPEAVEFLIQRGANVNAKNKKGKTVLMWAAEGVDPDLVPLLIKNGARVDETCHAGRGALIYAAKRGPQSNIQTLIEQGADVNATCKEGKGALMYAVEDGQLLKAQLLVEKGANAGAVDHQGNSVLMHGLGKRETRANMNCFDWLLTCSVRVSVKNKKGESVRTILSQRGNHEWEQKIQAKEEQEALLEHVPVRGGLPTKHIL